MKNILDNKHISFILIAIVFVIALAGYILMNINNSVNFISDKDDIVIEPFDPKNISYMLDGEKVALRDGLYEIPGISTTTPKMIVKYFGNDVIADVDGDGILDIVFVLTKQTDKSEFIYYIGVVLDKREKGGVSLSPIIVGDKVVLQKLYFENGKIFLNYIERRLGEKTTVEPTIADTLILKYDESTRQMKFTSESDDIEVDINKMSINMKSWKWVSTTYSNQKITRPHDDDTFLITFNSDSSFFSTTDCNTISGFYLAERNSLSTKKIVATEMACLDSMEKVYTEMISNVKDFGFTPKGELQLILIKDSGIMTFR